jgi:hypothetical protein
MAKNVNVTPWKLNGCLHYFLKYFLLEKVLFLFFKIIFDINILK